MTTAVIIAAVVGGGVLLIMRRIFPRQKAVELLRYHADMMRGKTVVVTGANCGIGKAVAGELVKLQARVIMACRDRESAEQAARDIRKEAGPNTGEVIVKHLDLASLSSVREFCEVINKEESKIDVLINNAGVYQCPYTKTVEGFEMQFGVNHLGHFLLTHLLLDRLKAAEAGRVVVVSSKLYKYGHINFDDPNSERGYDKAFCYSQSKLANLLFCMELSRRLGVASGVTVNAVSPGIVRTRLGRHIHIPMLARPLFYLAVLAFFRNALQGAQTLLYLACSPLVEGVSGRYFADCAEDTLLDKATDVQAAKRQKRSHRETRRSLPPVTQSGTPVIMNHDQPVAFADIKKQCGSAGFILHRIEERRLRGVASKCLVSASPLSPAPLLPFNRSLYPFL